MPRNVPDVAAAADPVAANPTAPGQSRGSQAGCSRRAAGLRAGSRSAGWTLQHTQPQGCAWLKGCVSHMFNLEQMTIASCQDQAECARAICSARQQLQLDITAMRAAIACLLAHYCCSARRW